MPFFSTAIFPSLETLRQRVEDVLSPLNLAFDQDTIALHVDLSAGASIVGVDRYWILRLAWTASTLTMCQRIESSASNSFPGTLRGEVCSIYGSIPAAIDLSVLVATFLASLLPGFGTVNTQILPPPPPANTPVITTLPDDDPVVVHPGGSDPVTTTAPSADHPYRAVCEWLDADGQRLVTVFEAISLAPAAAIASALANASNALLTRFAAGPVTTDEITASTPSSDPLSSVRDAVRLTFDAPAGGASEQVSLLLPAVKLSGLLPSRNTLNVADGDVAGLITACVGNLVSPAGSLATAYLSGVRDPAPVVTLGLEL